MNLDYHEEPGMDAQFRKDPGEVEKKVEQSLMIHRKELKRL